MARPGSHGKLLRAGYQAPLHHNFTFSTNLISGLFFSFTPLPRSICSFLLFFLSRGCRSLLSGAPCRSGSRRSPGMIPVTFSLSCWNLTSKVLLLRMEFCFVTNMTPFAFARSLKPYPNFSNCSLTFFALLPSNFAPSPPHHLLSSLHLHQWIFLSLPLCPLVSPLVSPWLSHVLFQSTGAQGGNEIWRPSLNGRAHILCNYLRLRAAARLRIYKSVASRWPQSPFETLPRRRIVVRL